MIAEKTCENPKCSNKFVSKKKSGLQKRFCSRKCIYEAYRAAHLSEIRKRELNYYYEHRQDRLRDQKKWRESDPERNRKRVDMWRKNNPQRLQQHASKQTILRRQRKVKYIQWLGGKCSICGYNINYASIVLHHKSFPVKTRILQICRVKMSREELIANFELWCQNCHMEFHNPNSQLEPLLRELDIQT